MATGARGEGLIQVGDQEYRILFTNRALAEAEQRLGKPVLQLLQDAKTLGMREAGILLLTGLEAARRDGHLGGKPWDYNGAMQVMDQCGFMRALGVIVEACMAVIGYDPDEAEDADSPPA